MALTLTLILILIFYLNDIHLSFPIDIKYYKSNSIPLIGCFSFDLFQTNTDRDHLIKFQAKFIMANSRKYMIENIKSGI